MYLLMHSYIQCLNKRVFKTGQLINGSLTFSKHFELNHHHVHLFCGINTYKVQTLLKTY